MSFERDGHDELRDYQTRYAHAWAQSGFPSDQVVAEVFVDALPPVTTDYPKELQPLFDLFRQNIERNVMPLNRYMENTIEGRLSQLIGLAAHGPFEDLIRKLTATPEENLL